MAKINLSKKFEVVFRNVSAKVHTEVIDTYIIETKKRARVWRKYIREFISKPRPSNARRNYTLWPYLREGTLYSSILLPRVYTSKVYAKKYTARSKLSIQNMYSSYGKRVGGELNVYAYSDGSAATFSGWKDRADAMMRELISQRMDKITDYRGVVEKYRRGVQ